MRHYNVWEFRGISIPQPPVKVARIAYPSDKRFQHEYQRIIWSGLAAGPTEALEMTGSGGVK